MKSFDLQYHLDKIYDSYPEAERLPVIGITGNYGEGQAKLCDRYYEAVIRAGGVPVIIPPVSDKNIIICTLDRIDGLILSGGSDYNPLWAGEEPVTGLHGINAVRDLPELLITRLAYNRQIPTLGICRGIQTLAMALGGRVEQDIHADGLIKHSQDADTSEPTHSVMVENDSLLYDIYGSDRLYVNSLHHQAVAEGGEKLRVIARSTDGIIEAVQSTEHKFILGVQWHPEWLEDGKPIFDRLIKEASVFARAKEVHSKIVTLDTHCDTPMFFSENVHFEKRDPHILVDLHKMTEGRQDAVTMVAYLPQPKEGESFADINQFHSPTPKAYADLIFDKIQNILDENPQYVRQARNPHDILVNKHDGVKSIVLGIENGLALEDDIANVRHFADRGITYITLCHNGDNDICDSARRSMQTHGGVSEFGEKVIKEMNRCGVMVDLSHGAESSFYDALEISSMPIVCSHSNCKAVCDVPRNLTDDQMRALAKKGGVAHTTLYKGFLQKDCQASIEDAIRHLEHSIDIMGIDHVGLGTDFDGDGGVPGLADSSELINFTVALLKKRYSIEDIRKIWGGNWLRLMQTIQNNREL